MIMTAKRAPNTALDSIVFTESSIGLPWSSRTVKSMPLYCDFNSSVLSLTPFTTSTVLASLALTIWIPMDSLPLVREMDSEFPTTSIVASSPSFTVGSPIFAAPPAAPAPAVLPAPAPAAPAEPAPGAPAPAAPVAPVGITGIVTFLRSSTVVMLPSTTTAF
ncbi:hypothetical protein D3C76_460350 [compost metagenome]